MLDPPEFVDVSEPQFKLKHKLRVFDNNDLSFFHKPSNSIASSSKYGLLFVCTPKCEINVLPLNTIVNANAKSECRRFPYRIVDIPGPATHLNINCDCTLLSVVIYKDGATDALIYNVQSFLATEIELITTINISTAEGIYVLDSGWNPAVPNIYTICKSNGSLEIYEFKNDGSVEKVQLPAESGSQSFCWSPKGKQIAVGSTNGNITQYKPDLKAVKVIPAPASMGPMISLLWVSNFQFIAIYTSLSKLENHLIVIDAPKAGPTLYTNYDDICYSHGEIRSRQFYVQLLTEWNTLIVASSNSSEVGVLGVMNDRWTQYNLADSGRAELPLSAQTKQDTFPVGLVVDFLLREHSLPYLLLLSNEGLLSCFAIVYSKDITKSLQSQQDLPHYNELLFKFYDSEPEIKPSIESSVSNNTVTESTTITTVPKTIQPIATNNEPTIHQDHPPERPKVTSKPNQKEPLAPSISNGKSNSQAKNTQAKIAKLIREDCCHLEAELNAVLDKGRIQLVTKDNSVNILDLENKIRLFVSEVTESLRTQSAEIKILKQSTIQSWAWYEEVKSRFTIYSNPTMTTLIRFQPLDSACERQLDDMKHLIYYLESQLIHGNRNLDEQWDLFQRSCKETAALRLPSTEMIYRTMVKHNATLQKQTYILKDISSRVQSNLSKRSPNMHLLTQQVDSLESYFNKLKLTPQNFDSVKITNANRKLHLATPQKMEKLTNIMTSHTVIHVRVIKPNIKQMSANLNTLLKTPSSPPLTKNADQFTNVNFTPQPLYVATDKAKNFDYMSAATAMTPPKETALPNPHENPQKSLSTMHLKRTHGFESTNSAFASTITSRQSQSDDYKETAAVSVGFNKNPTEFLSKQNQSFGDTLNKPFQGFETGFKTRSNVLQDLNNDYGVATLNTSPFANMDKEIALRSLAETVKVSSIVNTDATPKNIPPNLDNKPMFSSLMDNSKQLSGGNNPSGALTSTILGSLSTSLFITKTPISTTTFAETHSFATPAINTPPPSFLINEQQKGGNLFGLTNTNMSNTFSMADSIPSTKSSTSITQPLITTPKIANITPVNIFNTDNAQHETTDVNPPNKTESFSNASSFSFTKAADTIFTSGSSTAPNVFAASSPPSNLSPNTFTNPSIFGSISSPTEGVFQTNEPFADNTIASNNFGTSDLQQTGFQFGSLQMGTSSIFGGSTAPVNKNPFEQSNSIFGNAVSAGFNFKDTAAAQPKLFSQSSTGFATNATIFNANQPSFGTSSSIFGGQATFGAPIGGSGGMFGSAPIFGGTPSFGTSTFGAPDKIFGAGESVSPMGQQQSSTFANLANQNTTGFGSLAQSSPAAPVTGVTGGSSFSSWR